MTANLIRGRVVGEGVKDILLDENQSLKVVQCDEDGNVLGDMELLLDTIKDDVAIIKGAMGVSETPKFVEIIDAAAFTQTVTSEEIDFSEFSNFIVSYKTGALTDSPTMVIKLQFKTPNGDWIDDSDYVSSTISTATQNVAFKGYMEAYSAIRIVCTFGGSGNFADTSVAIELK